VWTGWRVTAGCRERAPGAAEKTRGSAPAMKDHPMNDTAIQSAAAAPAAQATHETEKERLESAEASYAENSTPMCQPASTEHSASKAISAHSRPLASSTMSRTHRLRPQRPIAVGAGDHRRKLSIAPGVHRGLRHRPLAAQSSRVSNRRHSVPPRQRLHQPTHQLGTRFAMNRSNALLRCRNARVR